MVTRVLRISLALVLMVVFSLIWTKKVAAHLDLISTFPADGSVLEGSPVLVTLTFNEEIDTFESVLAVFDSSGRQVDLGDSSVSLEDRTQISVGVPGDLAPDTYTVRWTIVDDADGHPIEGQSVFTIAETPGSSEEASPPTWLMILIVGILVLAILTNIWLARRRKQNN